MGLDEASIGPRPRGRGNHHHRPRGQGGRRASIGPRRRLVGITAVKASIGPRPRGRGNNMDEFCHYILPGQLQLGLDLAVEETVRARLAHELPVHLASIGPRPRGRGNDVAGRGVGHVDDRFNWASTSRSRKPGGSTRRRSSGLSRLQLGLDLAVEETSFSCARSRLVVRLQLGLDLAVEETSHSWNRMERGKRLQLGLDLAVEETPSRTSTRPASPPSFNWASTSRSRKQGAASAAPPSSRRASIGPRPRGRGNAPPPAGGAATTRTLQLGLDLAVEETFGANTRPPGGTVLQLGLDLAVEETSSRGRRR